MMRAVFNKPRHKRDSDEGLIPLINIVFLLLIFFMIAGQISNVENQAIIPPDSRSEQPLPKASVVLEIDQAGDLTIAGETIGLEQLPEHLQGDELSDLTLKVDKRLTAQQLDDVLAVLRAQNIASITLYSRHRDAAE